MNVMARHQACFRFRPERGMLPERRPELFWKRVINHPGPDT